MTRPTAILWAAIAATAWGGAAAKAVAGVPDLVANVSALLARHYIVDCVQIFRTDDLPLSKVNDIHATWRRLATAEKKVTAGVYSYGLYLEKKKKKPLKVSCYRSLKIMSDDEESREGYAAFSKIFSIKDAVWVLFSDSLSVDFFAKARVVFDDVIVIAVVKTTNLVEFHEVFRVSESHPLKVLPLGNWTKAEGLTLDNNAFYDRRSDLEGIVLRTASTDSWPASYLKDGKWDGFLVKLWKEIQSLINCTSVHVRSDNLVGMRMENGSWNGLVGMALRNEIDVLVSEIVIDKERSRAVRFLYPVMKSRFQIYTRHLGYRWQWNSVLKPFHLSVWTATFAWVLVATAFFSFAHRFCLSHGLESTKLEKAFAPFESFLFVTKALCQQGHHVAPNSCACRILFFLSYAVSGVLVPSYSASLVSSLAQKVHYKSFDSLQEMVEDGSYRLLVKQNTAQHAFFAHAKDKFLKRAYETLALTVPEDKKKLGLRQAVRALCHLDKYAVMGIEEVVEVRLPRMVETDCPIVPLTYPVATVYLTMATSRQNPFWGLINHHLGKLLINGIVERLKRLEFPPGDRLLVPSGREVGIRQLISPFIFIGFFAFVSVLVLLLEIRHCARAAARTKLRRRKHHLELERSKPPFHRKLRPFPGCTFYQTFSHCLSY